MSVDTRCPKCGRENVFSVAFAHADCGEHVGSHCWECGHEWTRDVVIVPPVPPVDRRHIRGHGRHKKSA